MAEKNIELDSVEVAAAVFGNCDRNIRLLENEFSVTAVCRGTQLRLSGEPANVAAASRAVEGMLLLIENHTPLEDQTVRYCISLAHDGAEKRVKELTENGDKVVFSCHSAVYCVCCGGNSKHYCRNKVAIRYVKQKHREPHGC